MNPKNTKWSHSNCGDNLLYAKNISQNYVSVTVKNATFLFVIYVLLLESIDVTKFLTQLHILNREKLSYEKIYKN